MVYGDYSGYVYLCRGGSITKGIYRRTTGFNLQYGRDVFEYNESISRFKEKCTVRLFEQCISVYCATKIGKKMN